MGWLNKLFNLDNFKTPGLSGYRSPVSYGNKTQNASGSSASKRLKLVLMHDRTQLSPGILEQLRDELVEVISKYVEIDKDALDINLESESNTIALVANIPVLRARAGVEETLTQQDLKQPSEVLPNAVVRQPDATAPVPDKAAEKTPADAGKPETKPETAPSAEARKAATPSAPAAATTAPPQDKTRPAEPLNNVNANTPAGASSQTPPVAAAKQQQDADTLDQLLERAVADAEKEAAAKRAASK